MEKIEEPVELSKGPTRYSCTVKVFNLTAFCLKATLLSAHAPRNDILFRLLRLKGKLYNAEFPIMRVTPSNGAFIGH